MIKARHLMLIAIGWLFVIAVDDKSSSVLLAIGCNIGVLLSAFGEMLDD